MARINLGKVVPEKGIDYFTDAEVEEIKNEIKVEIDAQGMARDIELLKTDSGHSVELTLDPQTYQIVLVLKNAAGTALSTQTIDLPNENAITNLAYNNGKLTITKQSGATSQINLTGLIEGLVTETDFNTFTETLAETIQGINETIGAINVKNGQQDEAIEENYKVINKLNEKLENQQKVIDQLPQVTGQGTEITLENTIKAQFTIFDEEGNSTQETTEGYNMLDLEKYPYNASASTLNGGTVTIKDGVITVDARNATGTANAMSETRISTADSIEAGTYYLGVDVYGAYESTPNTNIWQYRGNRTLTEKFIIKQWKYAVTQGNIGSTPILISNDTSKTTYEKYTNGASPNPNYEQPIYSAGDNGSITEKIQNRNFANNAGNGYIASDGGIAVSNVAFYNDFILIPENENNVYYYGSNLSSSMSNVYTNRIAFYNENQEKISVIGSISTPTIYAIPNGAKYVRASWLNAVENPMLVFGGAIPYVPHEEQDYSIPVQAPFRSIGDVRDCFVKKSDGWYERHYIGEKILNGTENWGISGNQNYFYYANNDFPTISGTGGVLPDMKCNYYQISTYNHIYNANDDYGVTLAINNNHFLALRNKDITTIAELKTWLSTHNVVVQYELAEPLDLPCTPEQVEQLENKPSTYKDFTIIQSQDVTKAYLEVAGIYDMNKLITRVEVIESES